MPFEAVIELSALDGTNGFQINGVAANHQTGISVSSAGDVNGDGIDDLIIGAPRAGAAYAGASYVVFGKAGGLGASFELSALDGTNGFVISGVSGGSGSSVAAAGDVNNDGFADVIIGAPGATGSIGFGYVVFGHAAPFAANFALSTLNGSNGFRVTGASQVALGYSVASAGDVNGDGFDDVILGGPVGAGAAYVVFGKSTPFLGSFSVTSLNGSNGFRINGSSGSLGFSVAAAGDINGDGLGDLAISARLETFGGSDSGATYVVFGKQSGFTSTVSVATLDGTNGFRLDGAPGDRTGRAAASAGDVNGDGLDDLIIGALGASPNGPFSGSSYVVFGSTAGFAASLDLSSLDGTTGFRIDGAAAYDASGWSVASAGDINGDGIADLLIGATDVGEFAGATYVVFGRVGGFGPSLDLSTLNGANGFKINGVAPYDNSGRSVAAAGDVNGDGIDDLIIGARYADTNGEQSGSSYVIYGRLDFSGTAGNETRSGGIAQDQLQGLGGNDVLYGLGGDDILDGGDLSDLLYGGDGADDLIGGLGGDILYGDTGADELSGGDGADKLYGGTGADLLNGGTGNDRMDGESDIDTLNGGAGNDLLDGGLGADVMSGGADNDIYIVDDAGDQTIELAGGGYDIVRTTLNWTLAADVEALELQGSTGARGTGNAGANNLQGNGGANTLSGLGGVDTINGNDGDDIIIGGQAGDQLRGGIGADTFRVEHAFSGALETDQIYDFFTAEGDIMDFSGAFAGTIAKVAAFTNTPGQMTLTFAGGQTTVKLDIDGNGVAEYWARINGDVTGDWSGWLL